MRWEVAVVQRAVYGVGPLRCKTSRAISQQQGRIVVIGVQGGDVDKTIAVEISRDYPRNDTIPGAHGIRTARRLRKCPALLTPAFRNTCTVFLENGLSSAIARSGYPSLLKSAAAIEVNESLILPRV